MKDNSTKEVHRTTWISQEVANMLDVAAAVSGRTKKSIIQDGTEKECRTILRCLSKTKKDLLMKALGGN